MNPDYERTPPSEVVINGIRCVNTDAETFIAVRDLYRIFKVK